MRDAILQYLGVRNHGGKITEEAERLARPDLTIRLFPEFRSAWVGMTVRVKGKCETNFKSKVKGVGQECPTHTSNCQGGNPGMTVRVKGKCKTNFKSKVKRGGRGRPPYTSGWGNLGSTLN
jgi:hypothetical protein